MMKSDLFDFPIENIQEAQENGLLYDRFNANQADDAELVSDIREHGVLTPLKVSQDNVLLDGHRRIAACRYLGLTTVPVLQIKDVTWSDLSHDERLNLLKSPNVQRLKTRNERLAETMVNITEDDCYQSLLQYRAQCRHIELESNISMGEAKGRARITTLDFLHKAQAVIQAARDDWPMTVRRVHYLLLNDPPLRHDAKPDSRYTNSKQCYQALSSLLVRARLTGDIPLEAIEDPTRPVSVWPTFENPESFIKKEMEQFLNGYWRDLMQGQSNHIEILVEKDGLRKIVERVAVDYTIPCTTGKGYSSIPPRVSMANRFRESGKHTLVLLILSDFDPDGEQIAVSFPRSLRDDFGIEKIHPVKVMLTAEDIRMYKLPSDLEAKPGSKNYARFVEKYGTAVTELDAAPKELIQGKLRAAVESVIDVQVFNHEVEQERDDMKFIAARRKMVMQSLKDN